MKPLFVLQTVNDKLRKNFVSWYKLTFAVFFFAEIITPDRSSVSLPFLFCIASPLTYQVAEFNKLMDRTGKN